MVKAIIFASALAALASIGLVSAAPGHQNSPRRADHVVTSGGASTDLAKRGTAWNTPDHPDWYYLNGLTWWKVDPTQQDHARLHAYLSMSAYGDFRKTCPGTFPRGFTVLQEFNVQVPGLPIGQSGYIAKVPDMEKIVIVFKGNSMDGLSWEYQSLESMIPNCQGCMVADSIYKLYMAVKKATNDFEVAKKAVKDYSLLFSTTGHGVGGSVAALAALDLGARNLVHYSHNQGMPRTFNYAALVRYDNLFQVLAGQSLVSGNDDMVQRIPNGAYQHIGSKVHIHGDKSQWLVNCYGNNENSTCLGNGSSLKDHQFYFVAPGSCGSKDKGF